MSPSTVQAPVAARAPSVLLALGAFTSPFDGVRFGPIGALADAFLLLAVAAIAVRWFARPRRGRAGAFGGVVIGAAVLAVGGVIGTAFSPLTGTSVANLGRYVATTCVLPMAVAVHGPSRPWLRRLAWAYVAGAATNGIVSLGAENPVTGRADGWSSHPNVLGLSCAFGLVLLVALLEDVRAGGRWWRWWMLPLGAALLAGVTRSGSRAALIVLVVGGVVDVVSRRRHRLLLAGAGAALLAATVLVTGLYSPDPTTALGRVLVPGEATEQSDAERAELAQTVLERINDHPVTGTGFAYATQAHNIYLQVADMGGVLGMLGFAVMAATIVHALARRRRDAVVAGVLGIYVGYLAAGFVVNTLWDRWLWVPVIIGLALASSAPAPQPGDPVFAGEGPVGR